MKNVKRTNRKFEIFSLLKLFTPVFLLYAGGFVEKMIF
jgi:hypothetical protein